MLHFSIFIYIKTQGNASNKYVDNTNVVGVWNWRMRILHYFNFMRCLSLGREEMFMQLSGGKARRKEKPHGRSRLRWKANNKVFLKAECAPNSSGSGQQPVTCGSGLPTR
jgi:hypothetical protein